MTDQPLDPVREARDSLLRIMERNDLNIIEHDGYPRGKWNCSCSDCTAYREAFIDAYRAAVVAEERGRARDAIAHAINTCPAFVAVKQSKRKDSDVTVNLTYHDPKRHPFQARVLYLPDVIAAVEAALRASDGKEKG